MTEEPTVFVTLAKVEALVRQEKEKASSSTSCLSLRQPYLAQEQPNHISLGIQSQIQKFDGRKGSTREHIVRLIESVGPLTHGTELCL